MVQCTKDKTYFRLGKVTDVVTFNKTLPCVYAVLTYMVPTWYTCIYCVSCVIGVDVMNDMEQL